MRADRTLPLLGAPLAAALAGGAALLAGAPAAVILGAAALGSVTGAWAGHAAGAAGGADARAPGRGDGRPAAQAGAASDARMLLDALPLAVLLIGQNGTIRLGNRAAAETFGLPPAGQLTASMLRARRLLDAIEAARQQNKAAVVAFSLPRGGELRLRAHVRPLGGGDGVLVAIEDETRSLRAAELHRDFVANASHELKTPLAALSGLIETLRGHAREDLAATERFLGMMAMQAGRMTRLVEDLLSLNRIELNERVAPEAPQDLAAIAAEVVEALRPTAQAAGVELILESAGEAPVVRGDRKELDQLFRNLVENAVKHGGAGTAVRVSMLGPADGRPGMAGVAVRDTGPGIAPEHIPRLTERFYRVSVSRSRETGGTGLGLAIVKHVVNRHRGRLEIESHPGQGSCFTVWLPRAAGSGEAPA